MKNRKKKLAFSLIELSVVILVIGLLIIGITQGSRIVGNSKLTSAGNLSKSSPIASMDKLLMWYDASSKDSYANFNSIKSGDAITLLKDLNPQSSTKVDLTGTATYLEQAINGLPAIDFNGSNQYLESSLVNSSSGSVTIITVLNIDNLSTLSGIVTTYGAWSAGDIHFNTNGAGALEVAVNPGGNGSFTTSGVVKTSTPYIVTMICDPSGKISGYINSIGLGNPYTSTENKVINLRISLGDWFNGTARTRFFNGKIGEVIIFGRAIKTNERNAIEDYLSRKWSIALK